MEKLLIALAQLAEAGIRYLDAKTANEKAAGDLKLALLKEAGATKAPEAPAPGAEAPKKEKKAKGLKEEKTPAPAPAAQPPAPAEASKPPVDPLGDTGPAAAAFSGAANPAPAAQPPAPAAPAAEAPKPLTEEESRDKLIKTMGAYLQLNKSGEDGGEAARAASRAILVENFKVAKIGDLTHAQRIEAIKVFEAKIAEKK